MGRVIKKITGRWSTCTACVVEELWDPVEEDVDAGADDIDALGVTAVGDTVTDDTGVDAGADDIDALGVTAVGDTVTDDTGVDAGADDIDALCHSRRRPGDR